MLKIQVVGSKFPPEYAGAGFRIASTYRRLAARGADLQWSVIAGSVEFPGHARYQHEGIDVERVASPLFAGASGRLPQALRSWLEALRVWGLLRTRSFDVLHVFGTSSVTAAAIAYAALARKPLIVELVTAKTSALQILPGARVMLPMLRRRLAQRCLIVAISQALAERCAADSFSGNVWTRPNPIDTTRYFPAPNRRAELRARHTPFGGGDIVLAMVAKFMAQKNQIFLIDVLAALPERFKLVLAGPAVTQGPLADRDRAYLAALRQRIRDLGWETRVHIVPKFVPADEFIKAADVYLLPNTNEGLATPMLEALACGVPVVGNAGEAAFRQWIDDGRNGYLRPLEAPAWAQAIERAVRLPQDARQDAARHIAAVASADSIDGDFRTLAERVAALAPGQKLDVAAVLGARHG